jgi:NAD(P)-dependent dehydrogenase (short-subunit alcohol dehydrogenase family)
MKQMYGMMSIPKKHVALITDSSKGIGRAIVLAFVKSNTYAVIVVNARKQDEQGT